VGGDTPWQLHKWSSLQHTHTYTQHFKSNDRCQFSFIDSVIIHKHWGQARYQVRHHSFLSLVVQQITEELYFEFL